MNPRKQKSDFGASKTLYDAVKAIWANVSFVRGKRALQNGNVDVYSTILVRCDYHKELSRNSRLQYEESIYVIESFNQDRNANEVQITAYELHE